MDPELLAITNPSHILYNKLSYASDQTGSNDATSDQTVPDRSDLSSVHCPNFCGL